MTRLAGIGSLTPQPAGMRLPASDGNPKFAVPDGGTPSSSAAYGPDGLVALSGLLALQEAETMPDLAEREAGRRGRAVLEALSSLQGALLGGGDPAAAAARLAVTVASATASSDPALHAILAAIKLRALVELARWKS